MSGQKIIQGMKEALFFASCGTGDAFRNPETAVSKSQWDEWNKFHGTRYPYPFAEVIQFPNHTPQEHHND